MERARALISIPTGPIESTMVYTGRQRKRISIPTGPIESEATFGFGPDHTAFQFLLVQLRAPAAPAAPAVKPDFNSYWSN